MVEMERGVGRPFWNSSRKCCQQSAPEPIYFNPLLSNVNNRTPAASPVIKYRSQPSLGPPDHPNNPSPGGPPLNPSSKPRYLHYGNSARVKSSVKKETEKKYVRFRLNRPS